MQVVVEKFGRVNGKEVTADGKQINCFLGIPFAQPPTENLRFRPPQPLPPADDTSKEYDATELPASCYQIINRAFESKFVDLWNPNTNMSEDCLYLNIWKPVGAFDKAVLVKLLLFCHVHE